MKPQIKNIILVATVCVLMLLSTPTNATLSNILKQLEEGGNVKLTAYNDGYGNWTAGFGSTYHFDLSRPFRKGDTITTEQAYRYLQIEMEQVLSNIQDFVKVPINTNQLYALASLGYNIGTPTLKNSTLVKQLNAGYSKQDVANRFLDFTKATNKATGRLEFSQGLYNRRVMERDLFLS